jgi:hypothetical protein
VTQSRPDKPITPAQAWQPFTPRGVAAFAHASGSRLFVVQLIVATIVALTCLWFVAQQWVPVVTESIGELTGESVIRNGRWTTTNSQALRLAGNRHLEIILDPRAIGGVSGASDISMVVTVPGLQFCGVLGCVDWPYETGETIRVSRHELGPAWEAWRPPVEALLVIGIVLVLLIGWWLLAILAAPFVKLIALFADRKLTWSESYRLGNAAFLPGAFIIVAGIVFYDFGIIDPLRLALFYALHLVCNIVFIATSPFFLPKIVAPTAGKNPFSTTREEPSKGENKNREDNPFRSA